MKCTQGWLDEVVLKEHLKIITPHFSKTTFYQRLMHHHNQTQSLTMQSCFIIALNRGTRQEKKRYRKERYRPANNS